jgi:repressor LexA
MSEDRNKRIFADNLNRIMEEHEKTPANLVADLDIPFSTLSNWTSGLKMPRMGNVEKLANYFHCEKSDLLEEHSPEYYENREVAKLADKIRGNTQLKALFDVQSDLEEDDLDAILQMALAFKRKDKNNY